MMTVAGVPAQSNLGKKFIKAASIARYRRAT
jgi:hypothetical protein